MYFGDCITIRVALGESFHDLARGMPNASVNISIMFTFYKRANIFGEFNHDFNEFVDVWKLPGFIVVETMSGMLGVRN